MKTPPSPSRRQRFRAELIFFGALILLGWGAQHFNVLRLLGTVLCLPLVFLFFGPTRRTYAIIDSIAFLIGDIREANEPLPGAPPHGPNCQDNFRTRLDHWIAYTFYPDKDYPKPDPSAE